MVKDYFAHFETGTKNAYKVDLTPWYLYSGPAADLDLDDSAPEDPFKIAIELEAIPAEGDEPAHNTFEGTVTIGDEELEFSSATRQVSETTYTAIPEIAWGGLDCKITIECVSEYGEPLELETLTEIEILHFTKQEVKRDKSGSGSINTYYKVYSRAALKPNDHIRFDPPLYGRVSDVFVQYDKPGMDIQFNTEAFRVFVCV